MKYLMIYIIFISLNLVNVSKASYLNSNKDEEKSSSEESLADSRGFHGKSKRIGAKSNSPGRLAKGIDTKGNIPRRYCDRDPVNSCWKESLAVSARRRCSSHRCTRENRIERRDLLRSEMRHRGIDLRQYRSMDDKQVTDKPQGVAAPTFEDDGDESKAHANEVPNFAEHQEVARDKEAHVGVNENDKRMKETATLESPFSYRRTSSGVFEDGKPRGGTISQDERSSDNKKMFRNLQMDDPPEFLEKLETIFSLFGDYIIAIMLKNLKLRLRQGNIAEAYQKRIEQVTGENGGNSMDAANTIEGQIRDEFGESFQVKVDRYLKLLVDHIELP